ncbi:MAG TPA: hypothetical protein VLL72_04105 [Kiloniellales bacterium]|nr:hypothetical protein [Kiloniellales bacterium]
MKKTAAMIAAALAVVAFSAGSALAACAGHQSVQSVSIDTQTASTGTSTAPAPFTPAPESSSD